MTIQATQTSAPTQEALSGFDYCRSEGREHE
jgi:hypothetical protein